MKITFKKGLALLVSVFMLLSLVGCANNGCRKHSDDDQNGVCDKCYNSVFVYFDFYAIGNLATKSANLDKVTDYFKCAKQDNENSVILSTGNMWANLDSSTTTWMNELGFSATTIGVNDFSLGEDFIENTSKNASFPLLAINVYDNETDRQAKFCKPSILIENDGIKVGVIGAVDNFYSAVSDKQDDIYFKSGQELTELVKEESDRLRKKGAQFVVYLLNIGNEQNLSDGSYYEKSLSDGYVDLVFEGNLEKSYQSKDNYGVYHLQNNGHNTVGISYAEVAFNTVTNDAGVRNTELVNDDVYTSVIYVPKEETAADSDAENNNENSSSNNDKVNGDTSNITTNDNTASNNKNDTANDNKNNNAANNCTKHKDDDNNEVCDKCKQSVIVYLDFYNINDLHGKLDDGDNHIGVDELTTYLKNARQNDDNAFLISTGDMWQGQAESNMTKGLIMTDWMNELDFTAMAIGNHEFDWGSEYIQNNADFAEFPLLAINIYDRATNKLASYCEPSIMVDAAGVQIGFIGAIGDCYSSIAADKCDDVYFKVGTQLTSLVKSEADKLRNNGADYIVYILHDGYGSSNYGSATQISSSKIKSYYDVALSNGYVDLVFEGHTHQGYRLIDEYGVYHIQNRGDNQGGISHAEIAINSVTNQSKVTAAELVSVSQYQNLADDPIVDKLLEKYKDQISAANEVLGYNSSFRDDEYLEQLVANLYYETGVKAWGDKYNIVLGGGFLRTRSPYNLSAGNVTYGQLSSLFTFDNQITLCSVKGRDLKKKFFESNNSDYFICCGDYGSSVKNNIDLNATYYIVVDNYTADYAYNNLTIVERYDPNVFARDLLAEYVKNGGLS